MENEIEAKQISAEERLKQIDAERKELKDKVVTEKKAKKEQSVKDRIARDEEIKETDVVLKKIQKEIFAYHKLGKTKKIKANVLDNIYIIINESVEESKWLTFVAKSSLEPTLSTTTDSEE